MGKSKSSAVKWAKSDWLSQASPEKRYHISIMFGGDGGNTPYAKKMRREEAERDKKRVVEVLPDYSITDKELAYAGKVEKEILEQLKARSKVKTTSRGPKVSNGPKVSKVKVSAKKKESASVKIAKTYGITRSSADKITAYLENKAKVRRKAK